VVAVAGARAMKAHASNCPDFKGDCAHYFEIFAEMAEGAHRF
jgi:hypothetical protein